MKKYEKYKDSKTDWIGNIPSHWLATRLKMTSKIYAGGTPNKAIQKYWENGTIPWIGSGEVNQECIKNPTALITEEAYQKSSAKWIPQDSLVIALAGQGKTKATVAYTAIKTTCNQSLAAIVVRKNNYKYLFYWLKSKYSEIRGLVGEERDGLNLTMVGNIPLPLPPLPEQHQIAAYLDYKTDLIDRFITNRKKQIELLEEQKAALINKAVTKGIDPNVKLKPSGVDWIGDIPEHWGIAQIKRITQEHRQGYYSMEGYDNLGHRVVRITDLKSNNKIDVKESPYYTINEEDKKRFELRKGDFLFQRTGAHKKIGVFNSNEPSIYGSFLIRFRFTKTVNNNYLLAFLNSNTYKSQLNAQIHGGVNPNIHADNIKVCYVSLPPKKEQNIIIKFLKKNSRERDALIEKYQKQINLMEEYKTALISKAVTGKIDVRDWRKERNKRK